MGSIAGRLGKSASWVSQYRRRLLEQGVIREVGRRFVAYEMPMMREFLQLRGKDYPTLEDR